MATTAWMAAYHASGLQWELFATEAEGIDWLCTALGVTEDSDGTALRALDHDQRLDTVQEECDCWVEPFDAAATLAALRALISPTPPD